MDRPDGRSPFLATNQMAQSFVTSSTSNHRSSTSQRQSTDQPSLSYTYNPTPFPPPSVPNFKSDQQFSPSSLLDNVGNSLVDEYPNLETQTFDSLQANSSFDLGSFASVSHASRVSPHRPWNPVNVSMTPSFDRSPSELQPSKKRLHTDSGYASSQKSRRIFANPSLPSTSFEPLQNSTYDEPIDSTAQQTLFLPEQQHRNPALSVVTSTSPKVPSVIVIEEYQTTSASQSFSCEVCSERFNTKSEMSKHVARHVKKWTCDDIKCPRFTEGFATKNDLDRHKSSVHHDPNAPRREFKCCVQGCKDPNKVWDRKDNFKAHVKRMHPDVNIDKTVEGSFYRDNSQTMNAAQSQTDGFDQDQLTTSHMQAPPSVVHNQTLAIGPGYNPSHYSGSPTVLEEDDAYDPSSIPRLRQAQYDNQIPIIDIYRNPIFPTSGYSQSATIETPAYPYSQSMAPTNNMQDTRPIMPYHSELLVSAQHGGYPAAMNQARPFDTRTAPTGDDQEDFPTYVYDQVQRVNNMSMVDGGMPAIDTVQQTTQSGAWDQPSQYLDYRVQTASTDQGLNPTLNFLGDEQTTPDSNIQERKAKIADEMRAILMQLPPDHAKSVVHGLEKDYTALDDPKSSLQKGSKTIENGSKVGFPCSRDGCGKSFTQNNIRTKHEQRHDRLFFCTYDGCYSTFGSKDDLRRHEKRRHDREAFEGWRCFPNDCPTSQHKLECSKFFEHEEQFKQHRRDFHRERASTNNGGMKAAKNCHVRPGKPGPFWCGFCQRVIPNDPNPVDGTKQEKFRYDHIDNHVKKDRLKIDGWVDLKSEGLKKLVVKNLAPVQANIEDSQEEEEQDELTMRASNTIGNTLSYVPTPSSQQWASLSNNERGKKRALSDAELNTSTPATKMPRLAAYQQRQVPSVAQAMTRMPSAQSTLLTSDNQPRRYGGVGVIFCCRCGQQRLMNPGMSCQHGGCYHPRCRDCSCQIIQVGF